MRLFTTLGIPAPATTVLLVGVLELGAIFPLLLDHRRRVAAPLLGPVMAVAAWTAGEWQAVAVILALAGLLAVDLGILDATPGGTGGERVADDGH